MSRLQYWIVTALGITSLVLLATNIWLSNNIQAGQADIQLRQQYVQQSVQLEGLYKEIIRALAELSARNDDADVRTMLAKHGITYSVNEAAPPPAAPARK